MNMNDYDEGEGPLAMQLEKWERKAKRRGKMRRVMDRLKELHKWSSGVMEVLPPAQQELGYAMQELAELYAEEGFGEWEDGREARRTGEGPGESESREQGPLREIVDLEEEEPAQVENEPAREEPSGEKEREEAKEQQPEANDSKTEPEERESSARYSSMSISSGDSESSDSEQEEVGSKRKRRPGIPRRTPDNSKGMGYWKAYFDRRVWLLALEDDKTCSETIAAAWNSIAHKEKQARDALVLMREIALELKEKGRPLWLSNKVVQQYKLPVELGNEEDNA